jgi:hypothetical protein
MESAVDTRRCCSNSAKLPLRTKISLSVEKEKTQLRQPRSVNSLGSADKCRCGHSRGLICKSTSNLQMHGHEPKLFQIGCFYQSRKIACQSSPRKASEGLLGGPRVIRMNLNNKVGVVGSIQLLPLERLADAECQHKGANPNPHNWIEGHQKDPPLASQTPQQWLCGPNFLKCACSHNLTI